MNDPFTIGRFSWRRGCLELRMVGTTIDGRPSPRNPMKRADHAHRWSSRQAARQFMHRQSKAGVLKGDGWLVLDLRRLNVAKASVSVSGAPDQS